VASVLKNLQPVEAEADDQEHIWRHEFEYGGYGAVKRTLSGTNGWDEAKRAFAFRWLREKESEVSQREKQMQLDTVRIEKDIDELRQGLTRLQQDTAQLREDKAQMERDTRQILWGSLAALVIAAFGFCVSMDHFFGDSHPGKGPSAFAQNSPMSDAAAAPADAGKLERHEQARHALRPMPTRKVVHNTTPQ
jgi:TolA-binding protein